MHNLRIIPVIYAEFKHGYQGFTHIYAGLVVFTHDLRMILVIYASFTQEFTSYAEFTQILRRINT